MIIPVVLSGGSGTRLWPASRELHPKQMLPLVNEHTMLQNTILRLGGVDNIGAPVIVCNESHRFMVAEQLRTIHRPPAAIILEPVGRNTAPAVALAALKSLDNEVDPVLLILPADHVIQNPEALAVCIENGANLAREGHLVTFGIVPSGPETGYGYIQAGEELNVKQAFQISRFVEKPDIETARTYIESGDYYWNSGMFMFKASVFLQELEKFAPEMLETCRDATEKACEDSDFTRIDEELFGCCPSDSIDYAVMEKTDMGVVIQLDAGWSDVGSWSALWEIGNKDQSGNVVVGDVTTRDSRNCYFYSSSRLVTAVGVDDHVVIETPDAVLVAHRDKVQDVKKIVETLKLQGRDEASLHLCVNRPWGNYECIDIAERYQVKRITVHPGASLSSQLHHHRAEHWVVVKGTAKITTGEETITLTENQSTYIPLAVLHRLENPGKIPLELIEVQSGSYLGEDDIVRFDDIYGRGRHEG